MTKPGGFQPSFRISNRVTAALTRIERARGFLDAAKLSEDWLSTMRSRALLLEAHHTTHIEGTRLTLEQAERLFAGQAVPEADPDDARELLNYRDAFEFVSGYLNDGGPITEGLIREIHRRLVAGVRGGAAQPGEYRRVQNYVANSNTGQIIYTPPPPLDVPPLMAELVAWLNAPTRNSSRPGERHRAVSVGPHSSLRGRQRADLAPALHALSLPGGLRLQAAVLDQRVLRPRPDGLLCGHPGRARSGHGPDRLARLLRRGTGDADGRGERERRAGDQRPM